MKSSLLASSILPLSRRFSSAVGEVHSSALQGFTAEGAALYEKGRPAYSAASLAPVVSLAEKILSQQSKPSQACIVELGAGTGKFTSSFISYVQARERENSLSVSLKNLRYLATEPSEGFRNTLAAKALPSVEVKSGTGANIPLQSESATLVVAAQAFHWMANTDTLRETHRVLTPHGAIAMIWNTYDYRFAWLRELDEKILSPAYAAKDDVPRQQTGKWRACFQTETGRDLYGPLVQWNEHYRHEGDRESIVNRIMSTSVIVERERAYQEEVLCKLNHLLDTHSDLEENRKSGRFFMPYITELVWCHAKK